MSDASVSVFFVICLFTLSMALSCFFVVFVRQKLIKANKKIDRLDNALRVASASAVAMGQELIAFEGRLNQIDLLDTKKATVKLPVEGLKQVDAQISVQSQSTKPTAFEEHLSSELKISADENALSTDSAYNQARASLAQGNEVSLVAKQCGLSIAEVSLLNSLSKSSISSS